LLGEEFEAEHAVAKPVQLKMVARIDSMLSKGVYQERVNQSAAQ
jgi:hypothetical protein